MRREGWWALLLLGVGGLLAADHVAASYWDFPAASGELPDAVRAYRAAGLPWTAADVAPPHVPESRNAVPLLKAAWRALPREDPNDGERQWRKGQPMTDFAPYEPALRLAHLAARKPAFDAARDWDLGPSLTFHEEAYGKRLCLLLAARAEYWARLEDDTAALADLEDARRLAVLIGCEPVILSALVGAAGDGLAIMGAERCLIAVHTDPHRLVRYRTWLASPPPLPDLVRALRGEILMTVANARNLDRNGAGWGFLPTSDFAMFADTPEESRGDYRNEPKPPPPRRDGLPGNTRSRAYMARCLQMWTELAHATHNLTDPGETIGARSLAVSGHYENATGMSHNFDAILFPVFSKFFVTNRVTEANRAVALAFADALILRARTGRWPTVLTTPDPLGKGPLKVRFDAVWFRVWSVGRDGRDDGGHQSWEMPEGQTSDDISAAYPPVPPQARCGDAGLPCGWQVPRGD